MKIKTQLLLVFIIALLAWAPALRSYLPLGDDFVHFKDFDQGISAYLDYHLLVLSISRILGDIIVWSLNQGPAWVYPIFSICLHGLCSVFLYLCILRFWKDTQVALLLSSVFAVSPFGFSAIYWASAFPYSIVTAIAMACILIIQKSLDENKNGFWLGIILFILVGLNVMIWDSMILVNLLLGVGIIFYYLEKEKALKSIHRYIFSHYRWFAVLSPLIAVTLYALLYFYFQSDAPQKSVSVNVETLISPLYYQYTLYYAYLPLFDYAVWEVAPLLMFLGCVFALLASLAIAWVVGFGPVNNQSIIHQKHFRVRITYLLMIFVASYSIYLMAGGYALDSRKRYAIVAFLLLALGGIVGRAMRHHLANKCSKCIFILLIMFGFASNWATIAMWNYESKRYNVMLELISHKSPQSAIAIKLEPDFRITNPTMELLWGNDLYRPELINQALRFSDMANPPEIKENASVVLHYENGWSWENFTNTRNK